MNAAVTRLLAIARHPLGALPTPLTPAPGLGRAVGIPALWIKHDELIGFGFGGNKVRGLEFLLADALAKNAEVLITGAGAQSNHVRATAACAAAFGMQAVAVYWGQEPAEVQGNLRLTRLVGAQTRFTGHADRGQVDAAIGFEAERWLARGHVPYVIPRGGACALGVLGHVLAAQELLQQCIARGIAPRHVVLAVGSGTTLAGWMLGTALWGAPWTVEGVTVSRPPSEVRARVSSLIAEAAALLGVTKAVVSDEIVVHDGFIGSDYGVPSPAGNAAIVLAARTQGVFLDPTYTGKAFAGVTELARRGHWGTEAPTVFIHTGGEPALFAHRVE
jgi:1-aminocyclopropane-1-carboxylate deaminase/D-cysteine desulfhydrase-like pyridoxal-dependent ACC family enzyme